MAKGSETEPVRRYLIKIVRGVINPLKHPVGGVLLIVTAASEAIRETSARGDVNLNLIEGGAAIVLGTIIIFSIINELRKPI